MNAHYRPVALSASIGTLCLCWQPANCNANMVSVLSSRITFTAPHYELITKLFLNEQYFQSASVFPNQQVRLKNKRGWLPCRFRFTVIGQYSQQFNIILNDYQCSGCTDCNSCGSNPFCGPKHACAFEISKYY